MMAPTLQQILGSKEAMLVAVKVMESNRLMALSKHFVLPSRPISYEFPRAVKMRRFYLLQRSSNKFYAVFLD